MYLLFIRLPPGVILLFTVIYYVLFTVIYYVYLTLI